MDPRAIVLLRELESVVTVKGDCMEPLLHSGMEIRVRERRWYLPGDVIVFRTPAGDLAAHRVLGWRPAGLVTKGDHCSVHDAPVARSEIVGRADLRIAFPERLRAVRELMSIVLQRLRR